MRKKLFCAKKVTTLPALTVTKNIYKNGKNVNNSKTTVKHTPPTPPTYSRICGTLNTCGTQNLRRSALPPPTHHTQNNMQRQNEIVPATRQWGGA
jgi:hypothetical protein